MRMRILLTLVFIFSVELFLLLSTTYRRYRTIREVDNYLSCEHAPLSRVMIIGERTCTTLYGDKYVYTPPSLSAKPNLSVILPPPRPANKLVFFLQLTWRILTSQVNQLNLYLADRFLTATN